MSILPMVRCKLQQSLYALSCSKRRQWPTGGKIEVVNLVSVHGLAWLPILWKRCFEALFSNPEQVEIIL